MRHIIISLLKKMFSNLYFDDDLEKIRYSIEVLYVNLTKIFVIFVISILINIESVVLIFFGLFSLVRIVGFGVHAKSSLICWIVSLLCFIGIPLFLKYNNLSFIIRIAIFCFSIIIFTIYAPSTTTGGVKLSDKQKIILKFILLLISFSYLILSFYSSLLFSNLLISSLFLEAIYVIPFSYKFLGNTCDRKEDLCTD